MLAGEACDTVDSDDFDFLAAQPRQSSVNDRAPCVAMHLASASSSAQDPSKLGQPPRDGAAPHLPASPPHSARDGDGGDLADVSIPSPKPATTRPSADSSGVSDVGAQQSRLQRAKSFVLGSVSRFFPTGTSFVQRASIALLGAEASGALMLTEASSWAEVHELIFAGDVDEVADGVPPGLISSLQLADIRRIWKNLDRDGSGTLSIEELGHALVLLGYDAEDAETHKLIAQIDTDGSGVIEWEEFKTLLLTKVVDESNAVEVEYTFQMLDLNSDGRVVADELKALLMYTGDSKLSEAQADALLDLLAAPARASGFTASRQASAASGSADAACGAACGSACGACDVERRVVTMDSFRAGMSTIFTSRAAAVLPRRQRRVLNPSASKSRWRLSKRERPSAGSSPAGQTPVESPVDNKPRNGWALGAGFRIPGAKAPTCASSEDGDAAHDPARAFRTRSLALPGAGRKGAVDGANWGSHAPGASLYVPGVARPVRRRSISMGQLPASPREPPGTARAAPNVSARLVVSAIAGASRQPSSAGGSGRGSAAVIHPVTDPIASGSARGGSSGARRIDS